MTSANARAGVDVNSTTEPGMPGRLFAYAYDNAGNRTSLNHNVPVSPSIAETFTVNRLNQITARENHALSVQGSVASNASIKVLVGGHSSVQAENSMAGRAANYWGAEAILANESGPANQSITVVAALVGGGSGGKDLVRTATKTGFLPAASESLTYDADGNLTADGRFTYAYDEANQLTTVTTSSAAATAGAPNVRLTFAYDAQGRRISRKIEDYSGSWTTREELRYVYNGWNLMAEMNTSGTIQRSFIWGTDLDGSAGGMGGIGALLAVQESSGTYFPAYDGSGNVAAMIKASDGSLAATYEYGPFGELLRAEGTYAATSRFRAATKYTDDDTGLVYYGHRYYSPNFGRFINRDPIGELGGVNLYAFVGNDPVNNSDVLGLTPPAPVYVLPPFVVSGTRQTFADPIGTLEPAMTDGNNPADPANQPAPSTLPPAPNKPDKNWKPNKADCGALRASFPNQFKNSGDEFNSPLQAAITASIAVGQATFADSWENYSVVYKRSIGDGLYSYSFTEPRKVSGAAMSGYIDTSVKPSDTSGVAITHGHNVGFQLWVQSNWGRTGADYDALTQMLSPGDQATSQSRGVPVLAYNSVGTVSGFNAANSPLLGRNEPGYRLPGVPSQSDQQKISACKSAGF